jgi:hypothetical protein
MTYIKNKLSKGDWLFHIQPRNETLLLIFCVLGYGANNKTLTCVSVVYGEALFSCALRQRLLPCASCTLPARLPHIAANCMSSTAYIIKFELILRICVSTCFH